MRYYLLSFFLFLFVNAFASKVPKYVSHLTNNGMVYFVFAQKMPAMKGAKVNSNVKYDISHLATTDTIIFNFTFKLDSDPKLYFVTIRTTENNKQIAPEIIYIEHSGSLLVYRLSLRFTYTELKEMFSSGTPFQLDLGNGIVYSYNEKKWQKQRKKMMHLFDIIDINKRFSDRATNIQ